MRSVLKNKIYDTKTAKLIGECEKPSYGGDSLVVERLYRKRTGEHFLCVSGGLSKQFVPRRFKDPYIVPLDYKEAFTWARDSLDRKVFDEEFDADAMYGYATLSIRVSARAARVLDLWVSRTGETKGDAVDRLIIEHLK